MVVKYNPSSGYFESVVKVSGTVFPHVLGRREFWAFVLLHVCIWTAHQTERLEDADDTKALLFLGWNEMKVISGITTFFEVFYTNQSFQRYYHLYTNTRDLLGNVCNFTFQTRLHHQEKGHRYARVATRYLLCSLLLFFAELKSQRGYKPEWENLVWKGLLTSAEMDYLSQGPKRLQPLALLHWSSKVTREGHEASKAPANELKFLIDELLRSHALQQEIADTLALPIPFQYFHLLNVMVVVNLLFWAYGMGVANSVFAPLVYFFSAAIFMGMMELASQLSDPFGNDDADFPISRWLVEVLEDAEVILEYRFPLGRGWAPIAERETPLHVERPEIREALRLLPWPEHGLHCCNGATAAPLAGRATPLCPDSSSNSVPATTLL